MPLNEKLRQLRRAKGLSQEALAEKLGLSRQAVAKWESGASRPSTENLLALAGIFGVSLDELALPREEEAPDVKANLAIICQAGCLSACADLITGPDGGPDYAALLFKLALLFACSLWMSLNLRRIPASRRQRAALIELGYCVVQALLALLGALTGLWLLSAALLFAAALAYIFVINPRYMGRRLVRSPGSKK